MERARAVSDYLDARGIDPARIDARAAPVSAVTGLVADRHVDVVIRRN
jgi:outer membrane protein OmpA-like peptidoglycan-associated protein